jgi:hypothetical protein
MVDGPRALVLGGVEVVDVRHLFPTAGPASRLRQDWSPTGVALHHDGVIMAPGDQDYSGTTLDEDLERLGTIYRHGLGEGWGGMPYHLVASPNGRCFYTLGLGCFGAHVAARNDELLGVALMGNFMYSHPGDLQLCAAGRALVAIWGWSGRLLPFKAHREWALPQYPTSCAGDTWWQWQNRLLVLTVAVARLLFP